MLYDGSQKKQHQEGLWLAFLVPYSTFESCVEFIHSNIAPPLIPSLPVGKDPRLLLHFGDHF